MSVYRYAVLLFSEESGSIKTVWVFSNSAESAITAVAKGNLGFTIVAAIENPNPGSLSFPGPGVVDCEQWVENHS